MILDPQQWAYLHGKPQASGLLKQQPDDFVVKEELGFEPCGEGEHIYVWLRKSGLNSAYVAEQLARFAGVHPRAVTFSGRKDKYAVTEQWFGVHMPGKHDPDWKDFSLPGARILETKRHHKKLRTGIHKGNKFELVLRNLQHSDTLEQRLKKLSQGVPNYFGPQRFGSNNGNLHLGLRMLQGESIRNRQKRSMAISALRAWLFNQTLSERIRLGHFDKILTGDIMVLSGSNSYFCAEAVDEALENRLGSGDILLSAPLWGQGLPDSRSDALKFEQQVAGQYEMLSKGLEELGLKQDRRAINLLPKNPQWQIADDTLKLTFSLPPGGFATALIREVLTAEEQTRGTEHAHTTEQ